MSESEQMLKDYEEKGYIILDHLISKQQAEALKDEVRKIVSVDSKNGPNDFFENGVYVGLAKQNDLFKEVAHHERILEALQQVNEAVPEFVSDKIVAKSSGTAFGSPWHQDRAYWKGKNRLSVWIAMDDANVSNGCLKILPESHKQELQHGGGSEDGLGFNNRIREEDIDPSKVISLEVKTGGAVIFHDLLLHASHPNVSGKDRWSLVSTYEFKAID